MRKLMAAAAMILASECLHAAPDNSVTVETLKGQNLAPLSAEELQRLVHAGATFSHRAPSTGNWRRISLKEDGNLTISNRSTDYGGQLGASGSGAWRLEGNRMCLDIQWNGGGTENWCRGIYRFNGGMYSAPVHLENAKAATYGLIEFGD